MEECITIKNYLRLYEEASGQQVNFGKSLILFSPNVSEETTRQICNILNVPVCRNHGKYLGALSLIGCNKAEVFSYVKENAWRRLNNWRNKFFSKAGKEVL